MNEILDILSRIEDQNARIEKQNLEILSRFTPKPNKNFLSVEDAADRLDRSAWTVSRLCNANLIIAFKGDNGRWRIPADEVARLEEEGTPRLPSRTPAPSPLSARRGKDAGSVASSLPSHAAI